MGDIRDIIIQIMEKQRKINRRMDKMVNHMGIVLQAPEERRHPGMANVQMEDETS